MFPPVDADDPSFSKRMAVFGGVMSGGYTMDCNDLYFVDVNFYEEVLGRWTGDPPC